MYLVRAKKLVTVLIALIFNLIFYKIKRFEVANLRQRQIQEHPNSQSKENSD
jgi:uncharacterized protein (DUF2062 family)